jgi:hypothetical protein
VRARICEPVPQDCEHGVHVSHSSTSQATGQGKSLHVAAASSCASVGHCAPWRGAALNCSLLCTVALLVIVPTPFAPEQDREQLPQLPQVQLQSTGQGPSLHTTASVQIPVAALQFTGHAVPPPDSHTTTVCVRLWSPPSQSAEHVSNSVNVVSSQSIEQPSHVLGGPGTAANLVISPDVWTLTPLSSIACTCACATSSRVWHCASCARASPVHPPGCALHSCCRLSHSVLLSPTAAIQSALPAAAMSLAKADRVSCSISSAMSSSIC